MKVQANVSTNDPIGAGDLRRKRSRRLIEVIRDAAQHLPPKERRLMLEIFEQGRPISRIADEMNDDPRKLGRQVRRITQRVLDPRFRFVADHQSKWRPTRRKVACACVIEGLSIREAAEKLSLSAYTVRKHKEVIDALCEELPTIGRPS